MTKTDNSNIIKLPGQSDLSMSPSLVRHNYDPPEFLYHPEHCQCLPCCQPSVHTIILRLVSTQAACLVLQEELEDARSMFTMLHELYKQLLKKTNTAIKRFNLSDTLLTDQLNSSYLGCLLQQGEFLGWHQLWGDYQVTSTRCDDIINTISWQHMEWNPAHLVWYCEQTRSVALVKLKQERSTKRQEQERMMELKMSMLQCDDMSETVTVTPDVARPATSRIGQFLETLSLSFK